MTSYAATRSDGRRTLVERGEGGHQVDVNANADPLDDVSVVFDPSRDSYVPVAGGVFRTIFDRWGLYADGTLKRGFTGVNLQTYADAAASSTNDPLTGAALGVPLPVVVINQSFPDSSTARRQTLESYGDGTSITREDLAVGADGGSVSRAAFGPASSGATLHQALLNWGYEQRISYDGRTIRLLAPARAFVVTGQLP